MSFQYFGTSVGPEYAKKFARNFGIGVLILFAVYGVITLAINATGNDEVSYIDETKKNQKINSDVIPYEKDYLPYIENHSVPFDYEGRIDYDLLIKKILPPIFQQKLKEMDVQVETAHMVLLRGIQNSIYEEHSYQCGYVIDDDRQVYWLEGRIDKESIHDVNVFTENPMPCKPNLGSCWCEAQTLAEEQLIQVKTYLNESEEKTVADSIKEELKDNPNLKNFGFKVGRYNIDYNDENIIPFCGAFEQEIRNQYFEGSVTKSGAMVDFHLERILSPLCAIQENAITYNILENEN